MLDIKKKKARVAQTTRAFLNIIPSNYIQALVYAVFLVKHHHQ